MNGSLILLLSCILGSTVLFAQTQSSKGPLVAPQNRPRSVVLRPYRTVHVLSIGINRYLSPDYPELQLAEADAIAVASLFRDHYRFQVAEPLLGGRATKAGIMAAISNYQTTLQEDDVLIIFFAGHGDSAGPANSEHGFLIPADARVSLYEKRDLKSWSAAAIDMKELGLAVSTMKARHVLLLIDACYSGFFGSRSGGISGRFDLDVVLSAKSRLALTAGTREQRAFEASGLKNSIFTTGLLDNLRSDLPFSARELALKVRRSVINLSKGTMQPLLRELVPDWYGEFVFIPQAVRSEANDSYVERLIGFLRSRGTLATTSRDMYAALIPPNYRYGANADEEHLRWQGLKKRFEDNSALGDPLAMAALSLVYARGFGTEINDKESYRWALESVYSDRHPAGLFALSECYRNGRGIEKNAIAAERLMKESADAGFAPAIADVASATLISPNSSAQERTVAVSALEKVVSSGYSQVKAYLGSTYSGSIAGIPRDLKKSLDYFREAAEEGVSYAMVYMFESYLTGNPPLIAPNPVVARQWLQRAADLGYPRAQYQLAVAHYGKAPYSPVPIGLRQDFSMARHWAELAARGDNPDAMVFLGVLHKNGEGGPINPQLAREWTEKAAALGHGGALAVQAGWYLQGSLYPSDLAKAFNKAKEAAATGNTNGMYVLANCYERLNALTVVNHAADAMHWYIQAAHKGHGPSKEKVALLIQSLAKIPFGETRAEGLVNDLKRQYPASVQLLERMAKGSKQTP